MQKRWLVVIALALLAVAGCGGADPTPTPTVAATPTPTVASTPAPAGDIGVGSQFVDGGCLPAAPLGISVGDSWSMHGPVTLTGEFPGDIPEGTTSLAVSYGVTGLQDGSWAPAGGSSREGEAPVPVEDMNVEVHSTIEWRDDGGLLLRSDESELSGVTIAVNNLSPALTLDWECHQAAWMDATPDPGSEASTGKRVLASGATAIVFSLVTTVDLPDQNVELRVERHVGYDEETGRVALQEMRSSGTVGGAAFSLLMVQELDPGS